MRLAARLLIGSLVLALMPFLIHAEPVAGDSSGILLFAEVDESDPLSLRCSVRFTKSAPVGLLHLRGPLSATIDVAGGSVLFWRLRKDHRQIGDEVGRADGDATRSHHRADGRPAIRADRRNGSFHRGAGGRVITVAENR